MTVNGEDRIPTVLIVDDERVNLMKLGVVLEKEGFHVLRATSGAEARQIARDARPELILLDVMMPEEDGFETCARLKQYGETADIPIIFLSALSETADKIRGFSLGAVDYITKPFEKTEVMARVLKELLGDLSKYKITLLGTDISDAAIARASRGYYNKFEIERE
jgi:DNA-binding response OmpR family regulator